MRKPRGRHAAWLLAGTVLLAVSRAQADDLPPPRVIGGPTSIADAPRPAGVDAAPQPTAQPSPPGARTPAAVHAVPEPPPAPAAGIFHDGRPGDMPEIGRGRRPRDDARIQALLDEYPAVEVDTTESGPAVVRRERPRRWFAYPLIDSLRSAPDVEGAPRVLRPPARGRGTLALYSLQGARGPATENGWRNAGGPLSRSIPDMAPRSIPVPDATGLDPYTTQGFRVRPTEPAGEIELAGARIRPWYVQATASTYFGGSTANDAELGALTRGAGNPTKRGFSLHRGTVEAGADFFDRYFGADAKVAFQENAAGDVDVVLRAAEAATEPMEGFALGAGMWRVPFGIHNLYFDTMWSWLNAPVIRGRLLGEDGGEGIGVRVAAAWESASRGTQARFHLGAQDATSRSKSMPGIGDTIGGRPASGDDGDRFAEIAASARVEVAFVSDDGLLGNAGAGQIGISLVHGTNESGRDGYTWLWGVDARYALLDVERRVARGWITAELMARSFEADDFTDSGVGVPKATLEDWGFYVEGVYAVSSALAAGLRYDHVSGSGRSYSGIDMGAATYLARDQDPDRHDRQRASLLLVWQPAFLQGIQGIKDPVMRFRIQYDYDWSEFLGGDEAHTLWIAFDTNLGVTSEK